MQKLSVCEFRNHLNATPHHRIIFDSVNQDADDTDETMRIKLDFDSIIINLNPNTISLKSKHSSVWFYKVKYVESEEQSLLGAVYNVVCGDSYPEAATKSYRIVVA